MSRVRLLREPEDRKARIGGTRTGVDVDGCALWLTGGRYETGGRCETDTRLSSGGFELDSALGRINSRWPGGEESFDDLSDDQWTAWAASTACRRSEFSVGGGQEEDVATFDLRDVRDRRLRDRATTDAECGDSRSATSWTGDALGNDAGRLAGAVGSATETGESGESGWEEEVRERGCKSGGEATVAMAAMEVEVAAAGGDAEVDAGADADADCFSRW